MKKAPKISIITPSYNQAQNYPDLECIMIGIGSIYMSIKEKWRFLKIILIIIC